MLPVVGGNIVIVEDPVISLGDPTSQINFYVFSLVSVTFLMENLLIFCLGNITLATSILGAKWDKAFGSQTIEWIDFHLILVWHLTLGPVSLTSL